MTILGSRRVRGVFAIGLIVLVSRAEATVTQVDGTIVPTGQVNPPADTRLRMQAVLDFYEPPPADRIDAVKDATETPQIFRPRLASKVVFLDIRETAGFENSFGWYNIGDDVSTTLGREQNLHPVMGCGVPMVAPTVPPGPVDPIRHSGDPLAYVENAEEGSTIEVDFAAEQLAGRYKGGFIGFYLITPEDPASPGNRLTPRSINCGDFKTDVMGRSLFGFIYFTQKDLNNDGDFVHHLVYRSSVPDRFFFGFEDRFRGGDNDFEDMAMRIEGLTPPCTPSPEVCDGADNDCDGFIDAADPDLTGIGTSCQCDAAATCDNGPKLGQCRAGVTVCTAGRVVCHGGTGTPELCDGLDNNCDGQTDNAPTDPTLNAVCDGQDSDLCTEGHIVCLNGALVCDDPNQPNPELCNNFDDNCNGVKDEGNPGGGGPCGSTLGVCTPGTLVCVLNGGGLQCQGGNRGGPELCNGLDDDCDGVTDESPTDVGQPCGAIRPGECRRGTTICTGGILACAGEIGPSTELCNGKDDDCDGTPDNNPVDAHQPCGSSIGECEPGLFECMAGRLECTGGVGPTTELCNGKDDDCNLVTDDNVLGEGDACGAGPGPCSGGVQRCIAGVMECVGGTSGGTEVCNGLDDDCDGMIDNGPLCEGGECDHGECALPCVASEFPCPTGKVCNVRNLCVVDPCATMRCDPDLDKNLQTCVDGACQPLCSTITCPGSLVCRGTDGACVLDTCDYLPKCASTEVCIDATCQPNPCNGVSCSGNTFCRGGACVASCEGVHCTATEACQDGVCVATGCPTSCDKGVCNPATGTCQTNRCVGVMCPTTKQCEPLTGHCIASACEGVICPETQHCVLGQCGSVAQGSRVTTGGGGGCNAGATGGSQLFGLGLTGIVLGLLARRRRVQRPAMRPRRRSAPSGRATWLAWLAWLPLITLGGCRVNDYCIDPSDNNCTTASGSGDAGTEGGDDGRNGDDGGEATCNPNEVHPESCNHADDNCDGQVDEGFDLDTDPLNCGACGVQCNKPGAQTRCVAGSCTITACFPGFNDQDGDITGPYGSSNGCEYKCFPSNGGIEACDFADNNCNGLVDEGLDTTSDPNNCGECRRTCEFFQATSHCANSTCSFDPVTDCAPGYHDLDGRQDNGCEYQCSPTNGGVEACDVLDNDCDGVVDEGFDKMTDADNCGRCGLACQFPHATASCTAGTCGFNPPQDCESDPNSGIGFYDINGTQLDGCEYQCKKTNGGTEKCDGIDNDCDGVADDSPIDAGLPCASTTPERGVCVKDGTLVCSAGVLVCNGATEGTQELCNNLDDDCDGTPDDGVTRGCYTGLPPTTSGIGLCHPGVQTCTTGTFGSCVNEVTPSAEQCNGFDDDCDGVVDKVGGATITEACYTGLPATTKNVGTCKGGTRTCVFGTLGTCIGEVTPKNDVCGDAFDSDCDANNDVAEGCQVLDAEARLDEATALAEHSYDIALARGGATLGTNVYAAWSQLVNGQTEVLFRRSLDGGKTWSAAVSVASALSGSKVKPALAVAPGAVDRVVLVYQTVSGGVRDIHVQVSADGGANFGVASGALDGSGDAFHHSVAITGVNCVITWERLNTGTLNRDVRSRTSINSCDPNVANAFTGEITVNVGSGAGTRFAGRPQVGVTSTGRTIWVWREPRANSTRDIFAASTATLGAAPAADVRLDSDTGLREADFPVLRVEGTAAYVVWQDVATAAVGGSDVMLARSINGGTSWIAEQIIDDPTGEVSTSFTPSLAIDPKGVGAGDDVVAIAWEDRRQGSQIFASVSVNGGVTFAGPVRASSEVGDAILGQTATPQIATAGSGVLAVVYQNQPPSAQSHVFIATSIDTGATWTYSQFRLDGGTVGSAIAPQVIASQVAGKPAAVAAWTDFRADQVHGDIYIAVSH